MSASRFFGSFTACCRVVMVIACIAVSIEIGGLTSSTTRAGTCPLVSDTRLELPTKGVVPRKIGYNKNI